mmetsp:Transcript_62060/g.128458  ORF Transcript_62060/g.128458 Transcript_62060/m.128458 type:complete len:483 (-) Transcript_62060:314-1762(-)
MITFPRSYWPQDEWQWKGQIYDRGIDNKTFPNETCVKVLLEANPKSKSCQQVVIPISYQTKIHKRDTSIRKALKECYPEAVTCKDLTKGTQDNARTVKPGVTRSARKANESALMASMQRPSIKPSILPIRSKTCMSALLTFACLLMTNSQQHEHGYVSQLSPIEPKTQREARASPQAQKWKTAEQIELKTIWDMGTFKIVDKPKELGVCTLTQTAYVEALLDRFNLKGCNPMTTPCEPNSHLLKSDAPAVPDKDAVKHYQQLVGSLMYLACFTRPDIAYAVNQCAKHMSNPGPTHVNAAKRILKYLAGTKELGLKYSRTDDDSKGNVLTSYADSDHAGDPDSRRSVTGYVQLLNGAAVSWQSVRQQVVALSSAEAEYYAASVAGTDVQYIRRLAEELGFPQDGPTILYEDNMACIYMSESAAMYHKARHIDTRVYHLRELCSGGLLKLVKVESAKQVADSLTKPTPRPLFVTHRSAMLGMDP